MFGGQKKRTKESCPQEVDMGPVGRRGGLRAVAWEVGVMKERVLNPGGIRDE